MIPDSLYWMSANWESTTLDRRTNWKELSWGRAYSFDIAKAFGEKGATVDFRERIAEEVLVGARQFFVEFRRWTKLGFRKASVM